MNEERLICYDIEEVKELAARMDSVSGLEMPGEDFFEALRPMASVLAEDPGNTADGGIKRFLFTLSIPDEAGEDLIAGLWANAVLNAASVILERDLRREAEAEGLAISELRGPGLAGLPIELSRTIVEMTQAERIGVTVGEEGIMRPPFTKCGFYLAGPESAIAGTGGPAGCECCLGSSQGCSVCILGRNLL